VASNLARVDLWEIDITEPHQLIYFILPRNEAKVKP